MAYRKSGTEGRSAVEVITDAIRERIRVGDIRPGQRITQREIQEQLKVSSSSVREAFRVLHGEQLLAHQSHRGAVVRRMTRAEILETFRLREVVEGLAAHLAAERAAAGVDISELTEAYRLGEQSCRIDDASAYAQANRTLHEAIYKLSGSSRTAELARNLALPLYRFNHHRLFERSARVQSLHDHAAIVDAIAAGDADAAETAMRNHLRNSGVAMARALERFESDTPTLA